MDQRRDAPAQIVTLRSASVERLAPSDRSASARRRLNELAASNMFFSDNLWNGGLYDQKCTCCAPIATPSNSFSFLFPC